MKMMIKTIFVIALFFASTFLIAKSTGMMSSGQIESWLKRMQELSPLYVGGLVAMLLFLDLFIAIPTLTVTILSGFFLGYGYGAFAAGSGLMLAGICGYGLSYALGERILRFLVRDPLKRKEIQTAFDDYGFSMILLSRALPILPEVTACMAGTTRMGFPKFILAWSISTVPYVMIAAYSGSVSTLSNPMPAIFTAIAISGSLWLGWYLFHRSRKKQRLNTDRK